jgi:protein gp37
MGGMNVNRRTFHASRILALVSSVCAISELYLQPFEKERRVDQWALIRTFNGATIRFNPWRGCTKVSAGCTNCYAETLSHRNPAVLGEWGPNGTRVVASETKWREALSWDRAAKKAGERHRVFCASLADVFEDWDGPMVNSKGEALVANQWWPKLGRGSFDRLIMNHVRERLDSLIRATPNLDWLILTKRPENIYRMGEDHMFGLTQDNRKLAIHSNVWMGTTVENQEQADIRIPHLLRTPAAVRFLSVEPMLGPIDLRRWMPKHPFFLTRCEHCGWTGSSELCDVDRFHDDADVVCPACHTVMLADEIPGIGWTICGGESGPHARPFDLAWARDLRDQCKTAGVSYFAKQMGSNPVVLGTDTLGEPMLHSVRFKDGHGGDPDEWPADLKVRQFPGKEPALGQV